MLIFDFVFQAEDGIRDLVRSRGLGDVYKRQTLTCEAYRGVGTMTIATRPLTQITVEALHLLYAHCLLYTSDAADERSSVDLGGRRIIKKKKTTKQIFYTSFYN